MGYICFQEAAAAVLCLALFAIFSIWVSIADIRSGVVPRVAFAAAFVFFAVFKSLTAFNFSLMADFGGAVLGLFVFLLARRISGGKLGLADVWYSALAGLVLGPLWWHAAIGLACVLGALCLLVSKRRQIPFTPMLAAGSIAVGLIKGFRG